MVAAGLLLAFEGVDGCGKSTQVARCAEWLSARCPERALYVHREPGDTMLGERLRDLLLHEGGVGPLAEMLLYMAARAELFRLRVLPELQAGALVLLDRSHYSTLAYQGAGLGLDIEAIRRCARSCTGGRDPDRVLLLRVDPAEAARRRATGAAQDRIEARGPEYFARVARAYEDLAGEEPERFEVVDGEGDEDAVARRVQEVLARVV